MALMLFPDAYRALIRPVLFRLPPETAQRVADAALKLTPVWRALGPVLEYSHPSLKTTVAGLELRNPVGLAAGYDKNCEYLPSLAALGFGYVTGGTVTPAAQPGNPRPRVVRHRRQESLVNSLGFPGQGLDMAVTRLQATAASSGAPIVASVSGVTVDDIVTCHRRIEPLVSAVEINISSPNTEGLRAFHEGPMLAELLEAVNAARRKPLFVKIPPFRSEGDANDQKDERTMILGMIGVCAEHRVDGLTVANTWPVRDAGLAVGHGGLSGKPVSTTCSEWSARSGPRSESPSPSTPAEGYSMERTPGERCGRARTASSFLPAWYIEGPGSSVASIRSWPADWTGTDWTRLPNPRPSCVRGALIPHV